MIENLLPDEILALTLWGEARGEPIEGQIAVANVIINRLRDNPKKYKTVKDVCLEPKQFSCWNQSDPNRASLDKLAERLERNQIPNEIRQLLYIARGVIGQYFKDNTNGAKNYITRSLFDSEKRPMWARAPINDPIRVGNHVFFNV